MCKLVVEAKENKDEYREEEEEAYNSEKEGSLDEFGWDNEAQIYEREILQILIFTNSWYYDLKYYLTKGECLEKKISK